MSTLAPEPSVTLDSLAARFAEIEHLHVTANELMGKHLSMGVGGAARWLIVAESIPALARLIALLQASAVPWMMLGGGSNTVFGDKGYAGVVVTLGRPFREIKAGPGANQITAGAAAPLSALMNFAKRLGLAGLEFSAGIPGNLGGALAGNAGTAAGEICPLTEEVEVLVQSQNTAEGGCATDILSTDHSTRSALTNSVAQPPSAVQLNHTLSVNDSQQSLTRKIPRGAFEFAYRTSTLRREVIVGATLQLAPGEPAAIQSRIDASLSKRWEQPIGLKCSGCMFKNPAGDYAGRLIDASGLKGLRVGGASVSEKHANFMINDGTATAADLAALIAEVREKVHANQGVQLDLEVRIVGLDSA